MSQSLPILTGTQLLDAISASAISMRIKWLRTGMPEMYIDPTMAAAIVKGGVYEGRGKAGRVRYIREVDPRPKLPWIPCFRTCEAPVFAPQPGWFEAVRG